MPKVSINKPAPDFKLETFQGETFSLSDLRGQHHALLVFNRGFV